MKLTVRDVAQLFGISEKSVYRWIKEGGLPTHRVHGQYRFNRAELLEWGTVNRMPMTPAMFSEPEGQDQPIPTLVEALQAGGIFYRVEGRTKPEVLHHVVAAMRLPEDVDREFLLQVLLARETLGSTGIGDGIAVPHVRNPIVLHVNRPTVSLCFLEHPIDFGALDGQPVTTLFALVSPSIRAHLNLLSRLGFVLRDGALREALRGQAARETLMQALAAAERTIPLPTPNPPLTSQ